MVELPTLIEQQAALVSGQQKILITAIEAVGPEGAKRVNDAFGEIAKSLATAMDKYVTLYSLAQRVWLGAGTGTYLDTLKSGPSVARAKLDALISAGYTPESVAQALAAGDITALRKAT